MLLPRTCRFGKRFLTLSAVQGPLQPPLVSTTLPQYFISEIVAKHAHRPALIARQEKPRAHGGPMSKNLGIQRHLAWDFEEFDSHIAALARGLLGLGIKKGDRIGVIMGNNSAYAMLQLASACIGAILCTLNPAYRLPELISALKLSGISHLFIVPRIRSSSYMSMLCSAFTSIVHASPGDICETEVPGLKNLVVINDMHDKDEWEKETAGIKSLVDFRDILIWDGGSKEGEMHKEIGETLDKDDVINLQFTSGTTGSPKAVSLTHHNLLNNAISIGRAMRLTPTDVLCNVPPLFHCFGLVLGNLASWTHASCVVYPSASFSPPAIVDAIIEERCTALHGVPTHFLGVLEEAAKRGKNKDDFKTLRTGIAAGSPIPIHLMKELIGKLNLAELTNAYGMTETSPVSFQTTPADPIIKRVETVGKAQSHVTAKVVNPSGAVVPVGNPGEILISGYLVQKGYWNDEEQTKRVMKFHDGKLWMHTGDEGIMDEEGYLRIVGRIKDIIIRGGENLFPVQIENALTSHSDIREAAAVAVPDAIYGEVVGAWIVRTPGTSISRDEIRKSVRDRMNPQNSPSWIWFAGEDGVQCELPKTASGKVMKHILRDWSRELSKREIGRTTGVDTS